jgi:hypothetical protein
MLIGMGTRINRLVGFFQIVERLLGGVTPPDMRQSSIVRDPVDERSLRTLAAKVGQCFPDREGNFLNQLLPDAGYCLVAIGQARDRRAMLVEDPLESLFQGVTGFSQKRRAAGE